MTVTEQDYKSFAEFEKSAWVKLAPTYGSLAGQMTRQAVEAVLDAIEIRQGAALLDVATGIGYVAAEAERRGAHSVGIDFSAHMIDEARRQFPDLRLEIGDAENLSYEAGTFDCVVCAFGMLHFPRPGRALAEAYRVLRPGGRHAFTVWCEPAKTKLFGMIGDAMQKYANFSVPVPAGPGAFMLSDPLVCTALMDAARFSDVRIHEVPCHFRATSAADVFEFMRKCSPRAALIYDHQLPATRESITQALMEAGEKAMMLDGGIIQCPALLVVGRKEKLAAPV